MDERVYTLGEIEQVTGIPYEKRRYVVDQKLLPGDRGSRNLFPQEHPGRGYPRTYPGLSAKHGLSCAALLLAASLKPRTVIRIMEMVCKNSGKTRRFDCPLYDAYQKRETATLEVGDLVNLRVCGSADLFRRELDTGWRQVETGARLQDYEPMVVISLNAAQLRRCFEEA